MSDKNHNESNKTRGNSQRDRRGGRGGKSQGENGRGGEGRGRNGSQQGRGPRAPYPKHQQEDKSEHSNRNMKDVRNNEKRGTGNGGGRGRGNGRGNLHNQLPRTNDQLGISKEVLDFWKNIMRNNNKKGFISSDPTACELWRSCWVAAQTVSVDRSLSAEALIREYLSLPNQANIHPPSVSVLAVLSHIITLKSLNDIASFVKLMDDVVLVVKNRLMAPESLATIGENEVEVLTKVTQLQDSMENAILRARLKDNKKPELRVLEKMVSDEGQVFPQFIETIKRSVVVASCSSTQQITGNPAGTEAWMGWANHPTVEWLMSGAWHRDVPELKELYSADGLQEYAETLLRIWTVLTFYWGSAALWPKCKERQQRNGAEEYCDTPLLCATSGKVQCGEQLIRNGIRSPCGEMALWCCYRHYRSAICNKCLRKRQNEQAGRGGEGGTSTDVYDALVTSEESRREGAVLHLTQLNSRRPPKVDPNWKTTYRLQCSGLVAVVKLGVSNEPLQRQYAIQWAEVVSSSHGKHIVPEADFRRQKKIAVRLLGQGDLSVLQTEPELALKTHVAIIDLRVFVPEVLSVLSTFAHPHFAQHLQQISFAKRLIGLEKSPALWRLNENSPIRDYVYTAVFRSEIHCLSVLRQEDKLAATDQICALLPVQSLYGTQLEAFANALCSALHCTQGPPGTGKSYVGVCVILALMVIRKRVRSRGTAVGPILMLSYKNHALDEFLCDVLQFAPQKLRGGELIRLGKVSHPKLEEYFERNSAEERDAEKQLQQCIKEMRAVRTLSKTWKSTVYSALPATEKLSHVLRAMETLVRMSNIEKEQDVVIAKAVAELDYVASYNKKEYTAVFTQWLEEIAHWREKCQPWSKQTIPVLVLDWLSGLSPPPKCITAGCKQYCVDNAQYCAFHCCEAVYCVSRCLEPGIIPYCEAHRCCYQSIDGGLCAEMRLSCGSYCMSHTCHACATLAALDTSFPVQATINADCDACKGHHCGTQDCNEAMLVPFPYCVNHLCLHCLEIGASPSYMRLSVDIPYCANHACKIETCSNLRLLSVVDAQYCSTHMCHRCTSAVDVSSHASAQTMLCPAHRCAYAGYICPQPILDDPTTPTHSPYCVYHTCRVCMEQLVESAEEGVVFDYPYNVCSNHPLNAEEEKEAVKQSTSNGIVVHTGKCHGITAKGNPCKTVCKEPDQLYCKDHINQGNAVTQAPDCPAEIAAAAETARSAFANTLEEDEALILHSEGQISLVHCCQEHCRHAGLVVMEDKDTQWFCAFHTVTPTPAVVLERKPSNTEKQHSTAAVPIKQASLAPVIKSIQKDHCKDSRTVLDHPDESSDDDYVFAEDGSALEVAEGRGGFATGCLDPDEADMEFFDCDNPLSTQETTTGDGSNSGGGYFDPSRPVSGEKAGAEQGTDVVIESSVEEDEIDYAENENLQRLHDIGALESDDEQEDEDSVTSSHDSSTTSSTSDPLREAHLGDEDNMVEVALEDVEQWSWQWDLAQRQAAANRLLVCMARHLSSLQGQLDLEVAQARRQKDESGAADMKNAIIVGATVVGISRRLEKVRAAEPFAAVVEEACEVMEPTLISVLAVKSLQKLELVGDHRQLPAFVQQCWFDLTATMPTIKTSLFERLIGDADWERSSKRHQKSKDDSVQRVPFSVLDEQRRMRSYIADITRPHYKDVVTITDHGKTATQKLGDHFYLPHSTRSVSESQAKFLRHKAVWSPRSLAGVPGMQSNLFFWDIPDNKESRPIAGLSACNETEANAVVALCKWLRLCGTPSACITVITPYKGQKNLIIRNLRTAKLLPVYRPDGPVNSDTINVSTVDTFQGDENDVIILSMVRVRPGNRFIELKNRFIVALSRARIGMFIVGSSDALEKGFGGRPGPPHWASFLDHLRNCDNKGTSLVRASMPLCCPRHNTTTLHVNDVSKFPSHASWGNFCREVCSFVLPCSHPCRLPCHSPEEQQHRSQCEEPVPRPCTRHTEVPLLCKDVKRQPNQTLSAALLLHECEVKVQYTRPCLHKLTLTCDDVHIKLQTGKAKLLPCAVIVDDFVLPCGHKIPSPKCAEREQYENTPPSCVVKIQHTRRQCGCVLSMRCCDSIAELRGNAAAVKCLENRCMRRPRCGHTLTNKCCVLTKLALDWPRMNAGISAPYPENSKTKLVVPSGPHYGASERQCDASIPECEVKVDYRARCGHLFRDLLCHRAFTYAATQDAGLEQCTTDTLVQCVLCGSDDRVVPCWAVAGSRQMIHLFQSLQITLVQRDPSVYSVAEQKLNQLDPLIQQRVPNGLVNVWKTLCSSPVVVQRQCGHRLAKPCSELFLALMNNKPSLQQAVLPPCTEHVQRRLRCGHSTTVKCCEKTSAQEPSCTVRNLTEFCYPCGVHTVTPRTCSELLRLQDAADAGKLLCESMVTASLYRCGHTVEVPCHQQAVVTATTSLGSKLQGAVVECGVYYCDPCDQVKCLHSVEIRYPCGHIAGDIPCHTAFSWVADDFSTAPKCTTKIEIDNPVCRHPLLVDCWKAQLLQKWEPWPTGRPDVELYQSANNEGTLEERSLLFQDEVLPTQLPAGLDIQCVACTYPTGYVRSDCDHILLTECSRAYWKNVDPCKESVTVVCEKTDCQHIRSLLCHKFTASQRGTGKPNICKNIVSRVCQVCQINPVPIACFKEDVRCEAPVQAELPCGHVSRWICGTSADPRRLPNPSEACRLCLSAHWQEYRQVLQEHVLDVDPFTVLRAQMLDKVNEMVTVTQLAEVGETCALVHREARTRIVQALLDCLNSTDESVKVSSPSQHGCFTLDELNDRTSYKLVFCLTPRDVTTDKADALFQHLTDTPFGKGVLLTALTDTALQGAFVTASKANEDGSLNLCIGVLYTNKVLVTNKAFAVGHGKNHKKEVAQAVQTQRLQGYDAVVYQPAGAAGPTQWVTWEAGTAVPLLLVTVTQRFECCICMDRGGSEAGFICISRTKQGVICETFTCWECLQHSFTAASKPDAIPGTLDHDGLLLCANPQCKCPITWELLSDERAPAFILKAQQNLCSLITKDREVQKALAQQKQQIEAEYARIERIKDKDEKEAAKLRQKLVEEVLTLRCPRCSIAFVDFDACFALTCGNNNCRAGFCAWCLKDCGADAHSHVANCPENGAKRRNVFSTKEKFDEHHRLRKIKQIKKSIADAELSTQAKAKLRTLLHADLKGLNIQDTDVF